MKVKAFITAAGLGKRFGALTRQTNKCLMKINHKPLILDILSKLKAAGIGDIYVASGYQSQAVERTLDGQAKVLLNPFYRVCGILGSFWQARHALEGKPFVFTTSDHYFQPSVLRDCLKTGQDDLRVVVQAKNAYTKEDAKVIIHGLNVVDLSKNIPVKEAHGEFGGMAFFSGKASKYFFQELRDHFEKEGLNGYMMDILKRVKRKYSIPIRYSLCKEGSRIEIDSVRDLIQARQMASAVRR